MGKLIMEVYIRQTLDGPVVSFKWMADARESLEREKCGRDIVGEALATFGEQLRMQGLGLTAQGPASLYGPHGEIIR